MVCRVVEWFKMLVVCVVGLKSREILQLREAGYINAILNATRVTLVARARPFTGAQTSYSRFTISDTSCVSTVQRCIDGVLALVHCAFDALRLRQVAPKAALRHRFSTSMVT